jgi:hypothetical protein
MFKTAFLTFTAIGLTLSGSFSTTISRSICWECRYGAAIFVLDGKDTALAKKQRY